MCPHILLYVPSRRVVSALYLYSAELVSTYYRCVLIFYTPTKYYYYIIYYL